MYVHMKKSMKNVKERISGNVRDRVEVNNTECSFDQISSDSESVFDLDKVLADIRDFDKGQDAALYYPGHQYPTLPSCQCDEDQKLCKLIAGDQTWYTDHFGCSFSGSIKELFEVDFNDGPYLQRPWRCVW